MKLHLPLSLRRSLLSFLAAIVSAPAWGATLSSEVDLQVYADFGQNRGRYSTSNVNALLQELNKNGVTISYNNGAADYTLEHGMISFESRQESNGAAAAVCYNYIATVSHNGVQAPYFSYLELGESQSIKYQGIEYRYPNYFDNGRPGAFIHSAPTQGFQADFKLTRLSKIVTDVTTSNLYSNDKLTYENVYGELLYHSGGGYSDVYNPETGIDTGIERGITSGIIQIDGLGKAENGNFWMGHTADGWDVTVDPLPFGVNSGDSGSPSWIWDDEAQEYRYVAAVAIEDWSNLANGTSKGNLKFASEVVESYNRTIDSDSGQIFLSQTSQTEETISQDSISTTLWKGEVTDALGNVLTSYTGVQSGLSTWNDMSAIRDYDNWYARTQNYLNASQNNSTAGKLDYADLFMTDNLVFQAKDRSDYEIVLQGNLDLGIGYTEFRKGNQDSAQYTVTGTGYLDSAGYIIGDGVDVYLELTSTDKTREVRKIGDGNLHVTGTGNNDILLNLGGKGKTYLNQKNGYAAYNVLANNGSTVVLEGGISQIKRDFTFGNGGGTLDFHGHSWTEGAEGNFSMKALTQDAIIANYKSGTASDVTFTSGGTFLGSFRDTEDAALKVHYAGDNTWTLHSIHTNLQNAGSGLSVDSGSVVLTGTRTEHAASNLAGTNKPWNHDNDWHYADARMNVEVQDGAGFELGSHARLTGTVTVNEGGTYTMREGVQNRYEYIEGGYKLEDTYAIADFYGHKGDTVLNGTMQIDFSDGTTSNLTYAGNISGTGNMTVDTADGTFTLTGNNTFTGTKELLHGHLIADDVTALGSGAGWQLAEGTTMTVHAGMTAENLLSVVDSSRSSGLLVLGNSIESAVDLSESNLILGAMSGKTVQYGAETETVRNPRLGGGGGTLEVLAKVEADNLVLGRDGETGVVRLVNSSNSLTGTISMNGQVALDATSEAIGNAKVNLDYGKGLMLRESVQSISAKLVPESSGALLLDYYTGSEIDMSENARLSLSAAGKTDYAGIIKVGSTSAYQLGGFVGSLGLSNNAAITGSNALIVDAKGTKGGEVVLAAQSQFTGAVTVKDGSSGGAGSATFTFSEDNALTGASSVTVNQGGVLDVGSTTQSLKNLQVNAGGLLSSGEGGKLIFNLQEEKVQYGSMRLDTAEKIGSGAFTLESADNEWNLLILKEGTLYTRVDNALSGIGVTRVEKGATLNLNTWNHDGYRSRTMHGNIQLADDATMTTGNAGDHNVTLTGSFTVDAGGAANVTGTKWHLTGMNNNVDGGTINFSASELHFDSSYTQAIGGTINIASNAKFFSSQGSTDMRKLFNHINIADGKTLTLDEQHWNTIWRIDSLTGNGNLVWNSDTNHSSTARVVIGGNGEYNGNISFNRNYQNTGRTHQAYLEIAGDKAVSGAVINLDGYSASSVASLAISASNAHVKGLNGDTYSHLLAGGAPWNANTSSAHGSSARKSLIITGNDNYTFSGTVAGNNLNGLNLEYAGCGTQTFNGSSVVFQNVAVTGGGTLDLSDAASLQIFGGLTLGADSTLNMGNHTYELSAGNVLNVQAAGGTLNAAKLTLSGGSFQFDADTLSADSALLTLGGSLTNSGGATISFLNVNGDFVDKSYTLATGDWSGVLSSLSGANLGAMKAMFSCNDAGNLMVTFSANAFIWNGTQENNGWSASAFATAGTPNSNSNLLFRDGANPDVVVSGSVIGADMYFENDEDTYHLTGDSINVGSVSQSGEGTTIIDALLTTSRIDVTNGRLELNDINLNGGRHSVQNGTLAMKLSEAETIDLLHLGNDSVLELSGNYRLKTSYGSNKVLTGTNSISLASSKTILQDSSSQYSINGGSLAIEGSGTAYFRTIELAGDSKMTVNGANVATKAGLSFANGSSSVSLNNGAVLLLYGSNANEDAIIKAPTEGTGVIEVRNSSCLYAGGSDASANLQIVLGDGTTLGTSLDVISNYACDIYLENGDINLSSQRYYISTNSKGDDSIRSSTGILQLSGNIISSDTAANVNIGGNGIYGEGDAGVLLSGTADVSGDVSVNAASALRIAGGMEKDGFVYTQKEGVNITSKDGSRAATISGGSTLAWEPVIKEDGTDESQTNIAAGETGSEQRLENTAVVSGVKHTTISNALVELYNATTLKLQNVALAADTTLALHASATAATVDVSNVGLHLMEGTNAATGASTTTDSALTLNLTGSDKSYTFGPGLRLLDISTDMLQGNLTITGESLMVHFDGYDFSQYDAVQLSFATGVTVDTQMLITGQAQVEQGDTPQLLTGTYVTGENVGSIIFIMNYHIPEPSTSALGLLALAGLATRRRRRA